MKATAKLTDLGTRRAAESARREGYQEGYQDALTDVLSVITNGDAEGLGAEVNLDYVREYVETGLGRR